MTRDWVSGGLGLGWVDGSSTFVALHPASQARINVAMPKKVALQLIFNASTDFMEIGAPWHTRIVVSIVSFLLYKASVAFSKECV